MTTATRVIIPRLSQRAGTKLQQQAQQPSLLDAPVTADQRAAVQAIADDPTQHDARRIWARRWLAMNGAQS